MASDDALLEAAYTLHRGKKQQRKAAFQSWFWGRPMAEVAPAQVPTAVERAEAAAKVAASLADLRGRTAFVASKQLEDQMSQRRARVDLQKAILDNAADLMQEGLRGLTQTQQAQITGKLGVARALAEPAMAPGVGLGERGTDALGAPSVQDAIRTLESRYTSAQSGAPATAIGEDAMKKIADAAIGLPSEEVYPFLEAIEQRAGLPKTTLEAAFKNPQGFDPESPEGKLFGAGEFAAAFGTLQPTLAAADQAEMDRVETQEQALATFATMLADVNTQHGASLGSAKPAVESLLGLADRMGSMDPQDAAEEVEIEASAAGEVAQQIPSAGEIPEAELTKLLEELGNPPAVEPTLAQMEDNLRGSGAFQTYMAERGLRDPDEARKMLDKEARKWGRARGRRGQASARAEAVARGTVPQDEAQGVARAAAPTRAPSRSATAVSGALAPAMGEVTRKPRTDFAAERREQSAKRLRESLAAAQEFATAKPSKTDVLNVGTTRNVGKVKQ